MQKSTTKTKLYPHRPKNLNLTKQIEYYSPFSNNSSSNLFETTPTPLAINNLQAELLIQLFCLIQ